MFSKVKSCAVHGVDGRMIDVEADVNDGLPVFTMVGYLSSSVRESSERVRTALKNSGFHLPPKRITINLSPADMRKDGSGYDLAIATAVLLSLGVTAELSMEQTLVLGELSLDGSIKAIPGVLPMVICAREEGMTSCIVPKENVQEAALVQGISVIGVSSLKETMEYIQGIKEYENTNVEQPAVDTSEYLYDIDFSDVVGQESIKRGDGDCCGRISQCVVDRCCRRREIHAREASADDPATDELRRKSGSDKDIQCRRDVTAGRGIDTQTSVPGTTSHNLGICTDRWRQGSDTRGGELCTLWGAVSGRTSGIFQTRVGSAAPAFGRP